MIYIWVVQSKSILDMICSISEELVRRLGLADVLSPIQDDDIKVVRAGSSHLQASTAVFNLYRSPLLLLLNHTYSYNLISKRSMISRTVEVWEYMLRERIAISYFQGPSFEMTPSDHATKP
jgi:hypothetical protein